ncbi:MAG: hypothetical protein NWE93_03625 [Candidatus Bathyarchaeota archaeon]|nr:hypothetical protein [Candidatus Bathyarchaeota archaeon]
MQTTDKSATGPVNDTESKVRAQKKLVEEIKVEWKQLWSDRLNDRVKAEDISKQDYEVLRVERGTVIHASRDFKPLNFKEILEEHMVENPDRYIQPNPSQGGWTKFVKTEITSQKRQQTYTRSYDQPKRVVQQPKKGGRGWLHKA